MNYHLKLAFRNFFKHKFSSVINLVGLTSGLTCTFLIFLWVSDELKVDKFHEKEARLFQVMEFQTYSNERFATTSTPGILAENLKLDFPEIQYAATTTWVNPALLSYEQTYFRENGYHVGADFFNIFSYPLLAGDADQVLQDKSSICISREVAEKFFGSIEDAIGKGLRYEEDRTFLVSGVFEDIHVHSSYQFDFVLPYEDYKDDNEWVLDWGNNGPKTYIVLQSGAVASNLVPKIKGYVKEKDTERESNVELFLRKYSDGYLYGKYSNGVPDGGRIDYVRLFSIIAIFILVIACINFMNLSTARASKRAHEVGVRKAIGGTRKSMVIQFISESILISVMSMLVASLLVLLILPYFNMVTDKSIRVIFSLELIGALIGIVIITGFLAGSYPALYLSHFNPVRVLKHDIKTSLGEIWARKGLVIFQFAITIILLVGVIVVYQQKEYAYRKNLGYDRDNIVFFAQDGKIQEKRDAFFTELQSIPGVKHVSGVSHNLLHQMNNTSGLDWPEKDPETKILFENFRVDETFQTTLGLELIQGRWFDKAFGADTTKIVFNEAGIKAMGLTAEEAIGVHITLWEQYDLEIIGVLKDFHYQSIHSEVSPAFFRLGDTWNVAVKMEAGREVETMAVIEETYRAFNPGFIFDYSFLDKSYEELYNSEKRISTLSSFFAGFAILISCLGLFGLAAFTAERRRKEVGIRKVLGASVSNIVFMISKDFTQLVLISILIALPISYYFMNEWLKSFAYAIDLGWSIFLVSAISALLIAWITVSSQALKAAYINPAACLKDE